MGKQKRLESLDDKKDNQVLQAILTALKNIELNTAAMVRGMESQGWKCTR